MAVQVHAKVALSESKLAPIWAKLGSRQLKVSISVPKWAKIVTKLIQDGLNIA